MPISFERAVTVGPDVLVSELDGECVLLNLASESYYGLDEVGARIWSLVTTNASIEAAVGQLRQEYAVDPDVLRRDVAALVDECLEQGLLELAR